MLALVTIVATSSSAVVTSSDALVTSFLNVVQWDKAPTNSGALLFCSRHLFCSCGCLFAVPRSHVTVFLGDSQGRLTSFQL